jgi:Icc-related predicted phosphoesterase
MHRKIEIPPCDLLIHAGDITNIGEYEQLEDFNNWVKELGIYTICIPGNHDKSLPDNPEAQALLSNCELLIDSYTTFRGLKIYGSPWTPWFGGHYWVYNKRRGTDIKEVWKNIPDDTDILITHGPAYGTLDKVVDTPKGCRDLLNRIREINLRAHIFGHLHLQGGQKKHLFGSNTWLVNASICTESYNPTNNPVIIDINI